MNTRRHATVVMQVSIISNCFNYRPYIYLNPKISPKAKAMRIGYQELIKSSPGNFWGNIFKPTREQTH